MLLEAATETSVGQVRERTVRVELRVLGAEAAVAEVEVAGADGAGNRARRVIGALR
jgi:hypothetical protein